MIFRRRKTYCFCFFMKKFPFEIGPGKSLATDALEFRFSKVVQLKSCRFRPWGPTFGLTQKMQWCFQQGGDRGLDSTRAKHDETVGGLGPGCILAPRTFFHVRYFPSTPHVLVVSASTSIHEKRDWWLFQDPGPHFAQLACRSLCGQMNQEKF